MAYNSLKSNLIRSKSTGALNSFKDSGVYHYNLCDYYDDVQNQSDFSSEISEILADQSCVSFDEHLDSGFGNLEAEDTSRKDMLVKLELKVTKLGDILQQQHYQLQALRDEIIKLETLIVKKTNHNFGDKEEQFSASDENNMNDASKVHLDAIELQHPSLEIENVLKEFLKGEDLKNNLALTTAERIREMLGECLSETFRQAYLPFLERSHRRLLIHVTGTLQNAFHKLEENSYFLYKSMHKSSRGLSYAMEGHQFLLETTKPSTVFSYVQRNLETVLRNELKDWSNKILTVLIPNGFKDTYDDKFQDEDTTQITPISPPEPSDPKRSIIDQLMKSAQINRQIENNEINKAFETALQSSDLSLVMAACRAARPRRVFDPCLLQQPVLLALIQQLATDMVHDTQLKCRYLEDALLKLDLSDKATREHLPFIVGEIRKHLSKFLQSYPSHVASRRITLIIMAANNLLNK